VEVLRLALAELVLVVEARAVATDAGADGVAAEVPCRDDACTRGLPAARGGWERTSALGRYVNFPWLSLLQPDACDATCHNRPPNAPPDCSAAVASPDRLWPPNHRFADIAVEGVTDPDGDPVTITITSVTQDEPLAGRRGAGHTCPDADGVRSAASLVRAERIGRRDGRVYHVSFTADDGRGG
jgi:hypothetical protein